jgi:hypothetical protein
MDILQILSFHASSHKIPAFHPPVFGSHKHSQKQKFPQEIGDLLLIQKLSTFRNNLSSSIHPQVSGLSKLN